MRYRIKEVCKEKGINMEGLAGILGISPNTLTRNINGNPTIETLEKIATALNVSVPELFEHPDTSIIKCPKCGTELEIKVKNL